MQREPLSMFVQLVAKNPVTQYPYKGAIYDLRETTDQDLRDLAQGFGLMGYSVGFVPLPVSRAHDLGLI